MTGLSVADRLFVLDVCDRFGLDPETALDRDASIVGWMILARARDTGLVSGG